MRMPSHTALCSFVFSTILTSAFVPAPGDIALASAGAPAIQMAVQSALDGLRAEGFAGSTSLALPTPAASPTAASAATPAPSSPMSSELMNKISKFIAARGTDQELPADYARALGFASAGQTWPVRTISVQNKVDGLIHGVSVSTGSSQDIIIKHREPSSVRLYRAQRDGKVAAGLNIDATGTTAMIGSAAAQAEVDAECAYWSSAIDDLIAGK